jgi:hypothetical protein
MTVMSIKTNVWINKFSIIYKRNSILMIVVGVARKNTVTCWLQPLMTL